MSAVTALVIDAGAAVTVRTQAGATSLEFTAAPSMLQATTERGAVEVRVPGDAAYAVEVDTDVGTSTVSVRRIRRPHIGSGSARR